MKAIPGALLRLLPKFLIGLGRNLHDPEAPRPRTVHPKAKARARAARKAAKRQRRHMRKVSAR